MPAERVWSDSNHGRGSTACYLVRGYGEVFHVVPRVGYCSASIPLPTLVVPPESSGHAVAVLRDGRRILLVNSRDQYTLYDTVTGTSRPYGYKPFDDEFGTGACEAANGKIYVMSPDEGLMVIEDAHGSFNQHVLLPFPRFDDAGRSPSIFDGNAYDVATYGATMAVGGFFMPSVAVLDLQGKLQAKIGPRFSHNGTVYSFATEDENSLCRDRWLEGLYVDRWERIWVTPDGARICVFSPGGACLYMSDEWELNADEYHNAMMFKQRWGVDGRGWLWCGEGSTAYVIPELSMSGLAPALSGPRQDPSGLEPDLG